MDRHVRLMAATTRRHHIAALGAGKEAVAHPDAPASTASSPAGRLPSGSALASTR
ncbi:hypothetical protein ACSL103130_07420 [Actinomyces slackii]|uniref:Uncharacterized protein n=1 Tax=Actinomyces slackii TaxID=52774 RepID=A0A3S4SGA4_9ACTO|nr:Uncharacterised protein [Actinomyces slackii]